MPNWLMTIEARDGVGENRLQFTTRMSMVLALVPVWASTRATLSKITVCFMVEQERGQLSVQRSHQTTRQHKVALHKPMWEAFYNSHASM
jgi:hypothetical protein